MHTNTNTLKTMNSNDELSPLLKKAASSNADSRWVRVAGVSSLVIGSAAFALHSTTANDHRLFASSSSSLGSSLSDGAQETKKTISDVWRNQKSAKKPMPWTSKRRSSSSSSSSSSLGENDQQKIYLGTGCSASALDKISFDLRDDWEGSVGAKFVSKKLSNDFLFENAIEMTQTSCGEYEIAVTPDLLDTDIEFGFYLYSKSDQSSGKIVKEIGCEFPTGDSRCPKDDSPSLLATMPCARKVEINGNSFWNRVYDGKQTSFQWGSCEQTCEEKNHHCKDESILPEAKVQLYGEDYQVGSNQWKSYSDATVCTLGSGSVYDKDETAFHFDYSQASLITCPYDISQSKHSELTIEIVFKLDDDFNGGQTQGWIVGQDNSGYDRSLILSDSRYGGMGQGIGGTYNPGIAQPSNGKWHHAISTYKQGVAGGSFITLDGTIGAKTTANNNDGVSSFTIGGLQNYGSHGIKGLILGVRIYDVAFDDTLATAAYDDLKEWLDYINEFGIETTSRGEEDLAGVEDEITDGGVSGLPGDKIAFTLVGEEYDGSSRTWSDPISGMTCTLGTATTFNDNLKTFHFDYSQASLITCPYDISQSKHSELTIEIVFKLDDDFNPSLTQGWIVGQDNHGYDRSLILSDSRYGGVGQGIGGTYTSGLSTPSNGVFHHAISTYKQGVTDGSFVAIDGKIGAKTTANNNDGLSSFTIGGLQNFGGHGIKGDVVAIRIWETAVDETEVALLWNDIADAFEEMNTSLKTAQ